MPLVIDSGYITTFADPDVQAYVTAVEEADGQALEYSVAYAINSFVFGCKQDGIWDAIKASCILAGARTLDGALIPLKGAAPTNFNFVSGDYNRKTGLIGNGSNKYLDSNRANNADPQNSNHNSVFASTVSAGFLMGSNTDGIANSLGDFFRNRNNTGTSFAIPAGFVSINRNNGSNFTIRIGKTNTLLNLVSSLPNSGNLIVFGRGSAVSPNALTSSRLAFYSIGESLDLAKLDTRVTDLINAFAAAIP